MIRRPPRPTRTDTLFPYTTLFRSVTGDRTARGLDLPGGDPLRLHRLQPHRTEVQRGAALGVAVDAPLMGLATLGTFRLHLFPSPSDRETPPSCEPHPVEKRLLAPAGPPPVVRPPGTFHSLPFPSPTLYH